MADISLFKIENGKAKALDSRGNYLKTIGDSGATDARIQGDSITISYDNGKTKMYDLRGTYKKTL